MKRRKPWLMAGIGLLGIALLAVALRRLPDDGAARSHLRGRATVADRQAQFGPQARARLQPFFAGKGIAYPPPKLLLVGFKQERRLDVYAADGNAPVFVRSYPIHAASGKLGPKLRYGDGQVPEGFYRIESLNPNSRYHLALRVSYPSRFDRAQAERDGRTHLGGDIMIHGSNVSIGCLAMGDPAAEDLFVLAADVGRENIDVILSPVDFRVAPVPPDPTRPAWVTALYKDLAAAVAKLPLS